MSIKTKKLKYNKLIVSEKLYIGITDTINGFRSTLASCEVVGGTIIFIWISTYEFVQNKWVYE